MNVPFHPFYDRVLIRRVDAPTQTPGGLYLPDAGREKPSKGVVVAVGTGTVRSDGTVVPLDIQVDDTVMFERFAGVEISIDGTIYLVMRAADILGRVVVE